MSSIFGKNIKVSIFGQSHSAAIGAVIDGLPPGFSVDMHKVRAFLARRAPGQAEYTTARKEADEPIVLCGLLDGKTCGAPLAATIQNGDTRSKDYSKLKDIPRPGHADYTAELRYGGHQDVRGGGHFSGRLTAPLCFAGAICLQMLEERGVHIGAHLYSIAAFRMPLSAPSASARKFFTASVPSPSPLSTIQRERLCSRKLPKPRRSGTALGELSNVRQLVFPQGWGSPMFDGLENRLAAALFGNSRRQRAGIWRGVWRGCAPGQPE